MQGAPKVGCGPERAGAVRVLRHPLLMALGPWAFAHMVPNWDVAHIVLFGVFGGFAFLGQRIIDRRKKRQMGAEWERLHPQMRRARRHALPAISREDAMRLILAALVYALLLWAHRYLFGVSPVV